MMYPRPPTLAVRIPVGYGICATVALLSTFSQLPSGSATEQARLLRETARQLSAELGHASADWSSSAH